MFPIRVASLMGSNFAGTPVVSVPVSDSYHVTFDGTSDYIQLGVNYGDEAPITFVYDNDFSIAAWIYIDNTDGQQVFSSGNVATRLKFGILSGGRLSFVLDGVVSYSSTALSTSTWYHVAITYDDDANELKHYIDGSLDDTDTFNLLSTRTVEGFDARIGANSYDGGDAFDGKMGSVAIYDNLLTAGEVSSLAGNSGYDATSVGSCVGWWRMGDGTEAGSGSTIYDMSTNSVDGTLVGNAAIASGGVD